MNEKSRQTELENTASQKKKKETETIKAFRLGNNSLTSLTMVMSLGSFFDLSLILWLDISFNKISKIDGDLLAIACPHLSTLYLHANNISSLSTIKILAPLKELKSLTLYGNPVEEKKHYRNMIFYTCPTLHQLDFTTITQSQRKKVNLATSYSADLCIILTTSLNDILHFYETDGSLGSNIQEKIKSWRIR